MAKKKFIPKDGIVYSTDESVMNEQRGIKSEDAAPSEQHIRIRLDKKQRAGKVVTLVDGFELTEASIAKLAKELKNLCGTGGSAKDEEIILQGDFRQKVLQYFQKKGFKKAKTI